MPWQTGMPGNLQEHTYGYSAIHTGCLDSAAQVLPYLQTSLQLIGGSSSSLTCVPVPLQARKDVAQAAETTLVELQQRLQHALPAGIGGGHSGGSSGWDGGGGGGGGASDLERMVAADDLAALQTWAQQALAGMKR